MQQAHLSGSRVLLKAGHKAHATHRRRGDAARRHSRQQRVAHLRR